MKYATFWRRTLAGVIDLVVASLLTFFVLWASWEDFNPARNIIMLGEIVVVPWAYFSLMEASEIRATVGKLLARIVVTDLLGRQITFGRATGRYLAKFLSLVTVIGFATVFSARRQALHDMLADSLVLMKPTVIDHIDGIPISRVSVKCVRSKWMMLLGLFLTTGTVTSWQPSRYWQPNTEMDSTLFWSEWWRINFLCFFVWLAWKGNTGREEYVVLPDDTPPGGETSHGPKPGG